MLATDDGRLTAPNAANLQAVTFRGVLVAEDDTKTEVATGVGSSEAAARPAPPQRGKTKRADADCNKAKSIAPDIVC